MDDANKLRPPQPSGPEPLVEARPSAETDAHTHIHNTLSESGDEASQTSTAKSGAVTVGSKLGPYHLVSKLGQGGMGAVYEARHTKLDKTFALKVLPPEFVANEALLTRFFREMRAVGKLDHPNIIRAVNADEWNGTHFLVMEYIEGTDLSVLVKERGVLAVRDACKAIQQAAEGLQHAHEHGLVHRDIKPSNLFLTKSGQVKLLDLGLARLGSDDDSKAGLTSSGQMLGTPDYMAPEQWDDTHSVDARADLYSLGCTLGFLLTGKAPFDTGKSRSFLHIMKAHVDASLPDLSVLRPSVPAELNALFQRLLAKKPEDRFQTAAEVATALEPFTRRDERSRHAPRDEPNASPTPNPEPALPETPTFARSTSEQPSTSTPRSAHHAERDGYVDAQHAERDPSKTDADVTDSNTLIDSASGATSAPRSVTEPMHRGANATPLAEDAGASDSSRRASTTRKRVILAAGLLACVVLAVLFSRVGRGTRPTDSEISNSKSQISDPTGWHGWPADAPPPAIAPFDAEQAQQHQEAWAKYLGVPVEYTNSLGMKFRLIPPGEFMMGSTPEEIEEALKNQVTHWHEYVRSEGPQHKVILTRPNYLGVHEVTQAEYEKMMGKNPSHFAPLGAGKDAVAGMDTTSHPVEMVSWNDAAEFCAKLSQQEKHKPFYARAGETVTPPLDGTGYRLPTEAEWEYAGRGGTTTKYWIGDKEEDLLRAGWNTNAGLHTHPVGELIGNPFGLYDVHGNVSEWVQDTWEAAYYRRFQEKPAVDPAGPDSTVARMGGLRGGSWSYYASVCRTSNRHALISEAGDALVGFRVSLSVDAVRHSLKLTGPAIPNLPKASVTDASTSSTAKPLTPLPQLDLDETDPLPGWELPAGAPPPVVAPCEPTLATERQSSPDRGGMGPRLPGGERSQARRRSRTGRPRRIRLDPGIPRPQPPSQPAASRRPEKA